MASLKLAVIYYKKGTKEMNKLKELRNKVRKNNKCFSLVELIVVIVILAILIGVTIGGIFQYVNKSRTNTDVNNASSISSALSVLSTNKDLVGDAFKDQAYTITWKDKTDISDAGDLTGTDGTEKPSTTSTGGTPRLPEAQKKDLLKQIKSILIDGLPKSQSNNFFTLVIKWDTNGNMETIKCYTAAEPQE